MSAFDVEVARRKMLLRLDAAGSQPLSVGISRESLVDRIKHRSDSVDPMSKTWRFGRYGKLSDG